MSPSSKDILAFLRIGQDATLHLDFPKTKLSLFQLEGGYWSHVLLRRVSRSSFPVPSSLRAPPSLPSSRPSTSLASISNRILPVSVPTLAVHVNLAPAAPSLSQALRCVSSLQSTSYARFSFSSLHLRRSIPKPFECLPLAGFRAQSCEPSALHIREQCLLPQASLSVHIIPD
ncbi:hypothetical protein DL96DRAFT_1715553 [Flagelloscypha sp. PMI_526]|nr:hypothetical protein DL96DRAFT_1715553 [Flagelloscypha sp. PMI_526]